MLCIVTIRLISVSDLNRVFRALGKTMRNMKKHDVHLVLERAEEVTLLLQHRIARESDQLLQISHHYSPQNNTGSCITSFLREALEARSILSDSNEDDRISVSETEKFLDPTELHRHA